MSTANAIDARVARLSGQFTPEIEAKVRRLWGRSMVAFAEGREEDAVAMQEAVEIIRELWRRG